MRRAAHFGIPYGRRGTFRAPSAIRVRGREIPLSFPKDGHGNCPFMECFIDDSYGLSGLSSEPATILDIGANLGFFSAAARAYFPRAIVHAYEPNPAIIRFAQAQADNFGFTLFPEAVGATAGTVEILDLDGAPPHAQTVAKAGGNVAQIAFETALGRLGGPCAVDLVKIDCEGAEWDLFKAAGAWGRVRQVRMEYHTHLGGIHAPGEAARCLAGLGFKVTKDEQAGPLGTLWAVRA